MSNYEAAPATRMLATKCACCRRPLLDAKSVEIGIGPDCRKRAGRDVPVSEEARERANHLVYEVALRGHDDLTWLMATLTELTLLGFSRLAGVIGANVATVKLSTEPDGRLRLSTPYSAPFVAALRGVPGRRWCGAKENATRAEKSSNTFPANMKRTLWELLLVHFPGTVGTGPKGLFMVGEFTRPMPEPVKPTHLAICRDL